MVKFILSKKAESGENAFLFPIIAVFIAIPIIISLFTLTQIGNNIPSMPYIDNTTQTRATEFIGGMPEFFDMIILIIYCLFIIVSLYIGKSLGIEFFKVPLYVIFAFIIIFIFIIVGYVANTLFTSSVFSSLTSQMAFTTFFLANAPTFMLIHLILFLIVLFAFGEQ